MLTRCYLCCIERKSRMYVLERYECKVRKFICENVERKYKIIDLFAGAGGLSNGFEQTGKFEVIGAVEVNEVATKTYIKITVII